MSNDERIVNLSYDDALKLLARAISLKYDITQNTFASLTKIVNSLPQSKVESIEFRFYDEDRKKQ